MKLSDAVQPLPRQTTQFIHGVPQQFLAVGDKKSEPVAEGQERFSRGAYFMGKAVWAKGYTELLSLLESHRSAGKTEHPIDCYGNGEDLAAVGHLSKPCLFVSLQHKGMGGRCNHRRVPLLSHLSNIYIYSIQFQCRYMQVPYTRRLHLHLHLLQP